MIIRFSIQHGQTCLSTAWRERGDPSFIWRRLSGFLRFAIAEMCCIGYRYTVQEQFLNTYTGRLEEWIILCCFIRCITTECAIDLGSAWLNLLQLHPLKKCNIEERTIIVSLRDTLPNENFIAVK